MSNTNLKELVILANWVQQKDRKERKSELMALFSTNSGRECEAIGLGRREDLISPCLHTTPKTA